MVGDAAQPLGGAEHRSIHCLNECLTGAGLEPDQRAHRIVEETRRIAQPDPAMPGDKMYRFDPQPGGIPNRFAILRVDPQFRSKASGGRGIGAPAHHWDMPVQNWAHAGLAGSWLWANSSLGILRIAETLAWTNVKINNIREIAGVRKDRSQRTVGP